MRTNDARALVGCPDGDFDKSRHTYCAGKVADARRADGDTALRGFQTRKVNGFTLIHPGQAHCTNENAVKQKDSRGPDGILTGADAGGRRIQRHYDCGQFLDGEQNIVSVRFELQAAGG
jgi:hypothetical protein